MEIEPEFKDTINIKCEDGTEIQIKDCTREDEGIRITGYYHGHTLICYQGNVFKDKKLTEDFEFSLKKGRPKSKVFDEKGEYVNDLKYMRDDSKPSQKTGGDSK